MPANDIKKAEPEKKKWYIFKEVSKARQIGFLTYLPFLFHTFCLSLSARKMRGGESDWAYLVATFHRPGRGPVRVKPRTGGGRGTTPRFANKQKQTEIWI